ncbi:3-dehydroquinate synthase [uncultured Campylobacter sp.]|uniref:3-dehydroquinate synthase n=1 Tax=uncultured Campylobacter sp. TaxID=218934 RepID=UPI002607E882|nr:3-dehydroquinate synthase [uncultured Campylobacter sp.]
MKIDLNLDKKYSVFIDELQEIKLKGKVAIVTNPKVGGLWLDFLLQRLDCEQKFIITIPDGEEYKNTASVEQILEHLFSSKLDRKSTLIALGGGVISDITGFCASIYERGIDFINVPTTLLAQVDASVGGKTGVNNRFGKNLIGSFYQPRAVYCESKFLSTLPAREFAAGVAEAVKMAVCFDVELFKFFETHDLKSADEISHVIARCVEIKAGVVERDERESGVRAVLNYGHTFAHAIEKITDYKKFLHGEAVAIGMVMANALARRLGKLSGEQEEQIRKVLQKFALPIKFHVADADAFYELFFLDKKSENGKIKFILPDGIGKFYASKEIAKDEVIAVLKEFE